MISTYVCFLSIDILTVIIIFAAVSNSSAQFTLTSEFKLCKKRERMIPAGAEMDFGINPFPRKKIEWMKAEWGAEAESSQLSLIWFFKSGCFQAINESISFFSLSAAAQIISLFFLGLQENQKIPILIFSQAATI